MVVLELLQSNVMSGFETHLIRPAKTAGLWRAPSLSEAPVYGEMECFAMNCQGAVLVTGGAGYNWISRRQAARKGGIYRVVVYDNMSGGHRWAVRWGPLDDGTCIRDHVHVPQVSR